MNVGPLSEWVLVALVAADSIIYYFVERKQARITKKEWENVKEELKLNKFWHGTGEWRD